MLPFLNMHRNLTVLFICSWGLSGCLFDSGVEWKDEKYQVGWIDAGDNTLYCTIGNGGPEKIKPTIIGVGSNDLFVVVKRRPEGGLTQFYYIKKGPDRSYPCDADSTHGPYGAAQFNVLREELNLPLFEKYVN